MMKRSGLSLIEVVIVIAIIGILMAVLLPAIHSARGSARRTQCVSNLRQLGAAMHAFHDQQSMFPPGSTNFRSLHVSILPFIDQQALYASLPEANTMMQLDEVARKSLSLFRCPDDRGAEYVFPAGSGRLPVFPTNYVGNTGTGFQEHGLNGMFQGLDHGRIRSSDVTDGLSNTAAIAETLISDSARDARRIIFHTPFPLTGSGQLGQFASLCRATARGPYPQNFMRKGRPWSGGELGITLYNHVLYPNDASCTNGDQMAEGAYSAGSEHRGGVNVLMGDGHVRFFNTNCDLSVWRAVGSRDGGETVGGNE